jgi:hypothetical protein
MFVNHCSYSREEHKLKEFTQNVDPKEVKMEEIMTRNFCDLLFSCCQGSLFKVSTVYSEMSV